MVLSFWPGGMPPVMGPDLAHNRASQPSVLLAPLNVASPDLAHDRPANHGITGSANYEIRPAPRCI